MDVHDMMRHRLHKNPATKRLSGKIPDDFWVKLNSETVFFSLEDQNMEKN